MGEWLHIALWGLASALRSRLDLALENVALRQQLMVIRRQSRSLRLMDRDRLFCVWLRRVWPGWSRALVVGGEKKRWASRKSSQPQALRGRILTTSV